MRKNIVVGVCGSIAAYGVEIVRELKKKDWDVQVLLTRKQRILSHRLRFRFYQADLFTQRCLMQNISGKTIYP